MYGPFFRISYWLFCKSVIASCPSSVCCIIPWKFCSEITSDVCRCHSSNCSSVCWTYCRIHWGSRHLRMQFAESLLLTPFFRYFVHVFDDLPNFSLVLFRCYRSQRTKSTIILYFSGFVKRCFISSVSSICISLMNQYIWKKAAECSVKLAHRTNLSFTIFNFNVSLMLGWILSRYCFLRCRFWRCNFSLIQSRPLFVFNIQVL